MVSGSLSIDEGSGHKAHSLLRTYTEQFYEAFPYYLSIGMTAEQFWEGDPHLVKYYRQAEEIRNDKRNQELWLQGLYVYEAICDASPILQAFANKGTKARPYPDKPYAITKKQREREAAERERAIAMKGKRMMEMFAKQLNEQFGE